MTMQRTLGRTPTRALLVLVLSALVLLGGCGSRSGGAGSATDTAGSTPATPGSQGTTGAGPQQVALVTQTAAGGRVGAKPAHLGTPAAVDRFTAQFRGSALADKVTAAVRRADVPEDRVLLGAVVAVGCDIPPGVRVEHAGDGLRIVAEPVRSPRPECLAPMTTVAVVSVPAGAA